MAFNILSRSGWNRLWLVTAIVWWGVVSLKSVTDYPNSEEIDLQYEYDLRQVTNPVEPTLDELLDGRHVDHEPHPPSQALIDQRKYEATSRYADAIDQLPHRQRQHLVRMASAFSMPFFVYVFCFLFIRVGAWVIRGFLNSPAE